MTMVEALNNDNDIIENHLLMMENDDVKTIEELFFDVEHLLLLVMVTEE